MTYPRFTAIRGSAVALFSLALGISAVSCSSGASNPTPGTGGAPGGGTGGSSPAGTGGSSPAGTGGASSGSGGSPSSTGGAVGSGGASSTGGSSGGATGGTTGTGTGGVGPGSGGSTGTGTGGGSSATGGAGPGSGGASGVTPFFTENFESGTAGQQPAGWDNFVGWVKNAANPMGEFRAVVDGSKAHGGTKSVHFHGGGSPAMLTRPLPPGTNKLYVRAYFFLSRQLGMNPGANHETLLGIRKASGSANDEVRFGEIKGTIGTNEVPSDNIAPKMAQWGMGPVVAANKWACIEVAFLADQPQHVLHAWADGVMVHSITAPGDWQNGVLPMNWMNGKFVEFMVGWHSFSGATVDVWMDDLVLSTGPIGCSN